MKIKAFWVLTSLLLVLSLTLAATMAFAKDGAGRRGPLTSEINYWFVGGDGTLDDEGRLLVWEATIEGDITGEMKWWFVIPPPVFGSEFVGGEVVFYSARWEIWDGKKLLLAGESAGKTVFPDDADGMWDGHGVVTEVRKGFKPLKGRKLKGLKVYETGPVIAGMEYLYIGTGMFLIY
jgi:hypothetical protein